jgi:hypothetical protein
MPSLGKEGEREEKGVGRSVHQSVSQSVRGGGRARRRVANQRRGSSLYREGREESWIYLTLTHHHCPPSERRKEGGKLFITQSPATCGGRGEEEMTSRGRSDVTIATGKGRGGHSGRYKTSNQGWVKDSSSRGASVGDAVASHSFSTANILHERHLLWRSPFPLCLVLHLSHMITILFLLLSKATPSTRGVVLVFLGLGSSSGGDWSSSRSSSRGGGRPRPIGEVVVCGLELTLEFQSSFRNKEERSETIRGGEESLRILLYLRVVVLVMRMRGAMKVGIFIIFIVILLLLASKEEVRVVVTNKSPLHSHTIVSEVLATMVTNLLHPHTSFTLLVKPIDDRIPLLREESAVREERESERPRECRSRSCRWYYRWRNTSLTFVVMWWQWMLLCFHLNHHLVVGIIILKMLTLGSRAQTSLLGADQSQFWGKVRGRVSRTRAWEIFSGGDWIRSLSVLLRWEEVEGGSKGVVCDAISAKVSVR